jgi:hypothetical protein
MDQKIVSAVRIFQQPGYGFPLESHGFPPDVVTNFLVNREPAASKNGKTSGGDP